MSDEVASSKKPARQKQHEFVIGILSRVVACARAIYTTVLLTRASKRRGPFQFHITKIAMFNAICPSGIGGKGLQLNVQVIGSVKAMKKSKRARTIAAYSSFRIQVGTMKHSRQLLLPGHETNSEK